MDLNDILLASDSDDDIDLSGVNLEDILNENDEENLGNYEDDEENEINLVSKILDESRKDSIDGIDVVVNPSRPTSSSDVGWEDHLLMEILDDDNAFNVSGGSNTLKADQSSDLDIEAIISGYDDSGTQHQSRPLYSNLDERSLSKRNSKSTTGLPEKTLGNTITTTSLDVAEAHMKWLVTQTSVREVVSPLELKRRLRKTGGRLRTESLLRDQLRAAKQSSSGVGLIKLDKLGNISKQLNRNAHDRHRGPGLPTSVCVHSKFIAVGTSRSLVLVFDHFQEARVALGTMADSDIDGAVTTIDIGGDSEYLVAGYYSGKVILWDIYRGVALRVVTDAHDKPLTCVRFWKNSINSVISTDISGVVNMVTFTKMLMWWKYDVQCVLNGSAGQMVALSVLEEINTSFTTTTSSSSDAYIHNNNNNTNHHLQEMRCSGFVALSSFHTTFIVALEPSAQVLFKWSRPDDVTENTTIPSLAWSWTHLHTYHDGSVANNTTPVSPTLARGWGTHLQLLTIESPNINQQQQSKDPQPNFSIIDDLRTSSEVTATVWLKKHILVYLNKVSELVMFDTLALEELESVNLSDLKFVYAITPVPHNTATTTHSTDTTSHERNNNNNNKDKKKKNNHLISYQNSVRSCSGRLYMLGLNELRTARVLEWTERINALVDSGEWLEALALALDHYEGTLTHLDQKHPLRVEGLANLERLLFRYIDLAFTQPSTSTITTNNSNRSSPLVKTHVREKGHYQIVGGVAIEFCVVTGRTDLLFGSVFQRFKEAKHTSVFLELLEPYILNDKLKQLNPAVMVQFVEHYKTYGMLRQVEQCIIHLDTRLMDLNAIVHLCVDYQLYNALIYVYNKGLDDYITPIQYLIDAITSTSSNSSTDNNNNNNININNNNNNDASMKNEKQFNLEKQNLGHILILYLSLCLSGRAFPSGMIATHRVASVRAEVLENVFPNHNNNNKDSDGAIKKVSPTVLSTLLEINAEAVMKVLCDLFSNDSVEYVMECSDDIISEDETSVSAGSVIHEGSIEEAEDIMRDLWSKKNSLCPSKQFIVEELIKYSEYGNITATENVKIKSSDMEYFNTFIGMAFCLDNVLVSKAIVHNIIQYFISVTTSGTNTGSIRSGTTAKDSIDGFGCRIPITTINNHGNNNLANTNIFDSRDHFLVALVNKLYFIEFESNNNGKLNNEGEAHFFKLILPSLKVKQFHKCAVEICILLSDFMSVLGIYLKATDDREFQIGVFDFLLLHLKQNNNNNNNNNMSSCMYSQLKSATLDFLPQLLNIDRNCTAKLVISIFPNESDHVLNQLESDSQLQFYYLQQIMTANKNQDNFGKITNGMDANSVSTSTTDKSTSTSMSSLIQSNIADLIVTSGLKVTSNMHQTYIKLLCEFEPTMVYSYLASRDDYPLDPCLRLCEKYKITNATAFLLERTGDISGALDLIVNSIEIVFHKLLKYCNFCKVNNTDDVNDNNNDNNSFSKDEYDKSLQSVKELFDIAIALCKRHSSKSSHTGGGGGTKNRNRTTDDPSMSELLWFVLLDKFVYFQQQQQQQDRGEVEVDVTDSEADGNLNINHHHTKLNKIIKKYVETILATMSGSIKLESIWNKILSDHHSDSIGDFRVAISNMLDVYTYEENILRTANQLFACDMFLCVRVSHSGKAAPIRNNKLTCDICGEKLSSPPSSSSQHLISHQQRQRHNLLLQKQILTVTFNCGHSFHDQCNNINSNSNIPICSICENQRLDKKKIEKRRIRQNNKLNETTDIYGNNNNDHNNNEVDINTLDDKEKKKIRNRYIRRIEFSQRNKLRNMSERQSLHEVFDDLGCGSHHGGVSSHQSRLYHLAPPSHSKLRGINADDSNRGQHRVPGSLKSPLNILLPDEVFF